MYKNILVPMALDHGIGDAALEVAKALCAEGGKITALHVYEAPQGAASAFLDAAHIQEIFEGAKTKLEDRVAGMTGVTPVVATGHSWRPIIDLATQKDIDCIVIGSHKPGLIDYLLGSTAARVVRHAPCAVHVMRNKF